MEFFENTPFKESFDDIEVFLDMDGVLADFDAAAMVALNTDDIHKFQFVWGDDKFWEGLHKNPNFFYDIPVMKDATKLLWAVRHKKVAVLTALPKTADTKTDFQKRRWIADNIGMGLPVITCLTKDKPLFCNPNSVLIDDRAVNKERWERAGGRYIVHENANSTIAQLECMGVI